MDELEPDLDPASHKDAPGAPSDSAKAAQTGSKGRIFSDSGCPSDVELLEDAAWDQAEDEHDEGPEAGNVDDIFPLPNGFEDSVGDPGRRGKERILGQMRGHGGGDESRLDGEHVDAAAV